VTAIEHETATAAKLIAELHGEDIPDLRIATALRRQGFLVGTDLVNLARLALAGSQRDVAMYVHRLAARLNGTDIGRQLAALDTLPPVGPVMIPDGLAPVDPLEGLRRLRDVVVAEFPAHTDDAELTVTALLGLLDIVLEPGD
jgi:hypothetical protein